MRSCADGLCIRLNEQQSLFYMEGLTRTCVSTNNLHPGSIWGQTMPGKLLVALRLPLEKSYHLLHLVHVFR